jgi:hypothetical protein
LKIEGLQKEKKNMFYKLESLFSKWTNNYTYQMMYRKEKKEEMERLGEC